jgi:hypothetical protein
MPEPPEITPEGHSWLFASRCPVVENHGRRRERRRRRSRDRAHAGLQQVTTPHRQPADRAGAQPAHLPDHADRRASSGRRRHRPRRPGPARLLSGDAVTFGAWLYGVARLPAMRRSRARRGRARGPWPRARASDSPGGYRSSRARCPLGGPYVTQELRLVRRSFTPAPPGYRRMLNRPSVGL